MVSFLLLSPTLFSGWSCQGSRILRRQTTWGFVYDTVRLELVLGSVLSLALDWDHSVYDLF